MALERLIGLPMGHPLVIEQVLPTSVPVLPEPDAAVHDSLAHRADLEAAGRQLKAAEEPLRASKSDRQLALSTLKQSQDRFSAGVTTSVEVVQSEETLASSELDYINSLFSLNLGKISLARAIGHAETSVSTLLN